MQKLACPHHLPPTRCILEEEYQSGGVFCNKKMPYGKDIGALKHSSECPSRSARAVFLRMLAFLYPQACLNLTSPPLLVLLKHPAPGSHEILVLRPLFYACIELYILNTYVWLLACRWLLSERRPAKAVRQRARFSKVSASV